MANPYTVLFFAKSGRGPFNDTVFVGNPGFTEIVRDIVAYGTGDPPLFLQLNVVSPAAETPLVRDLMPTDHVFHLEMRQVVLPQASLHLQIIGDDYWGITVTGYRLDNPLAAGVLPAAAAQR